MDIWREKLNLLQSAAQDVKQVYDELNGSIKKLILERDSLAAQIESEKEERRKTVYAKQQEWVELNERIQREKKVLDEANRASVEREIKSKEELVRATKVRQDADDVLKAAEEKMEQSKKTAQEADDKLKKIEEFTRSVK